MVFWQYDFHIFFYFAISCNDISWWTKSVKRDKSYFLKVPKVLYPHVIEGYVKKMKYSENEKCPFWFNHTPTHLDFGFVCIYIYIYVYIYVTYIYIYVTYIYIYITYINMYKRNKNITFNFTTKFLAILQSSGK